MVSPFDHKQTDYIIVISSIVPIIAQVVLGDVSAIPLCINWLASGILAWIIWDIIERHHLGISNRNHSVAISWTLTSIVLNYALINFNEYETGIGTIWFIIGKWEWMYLSQIFGFLIIMFSAMQTWQQRTATINLLVCGLVIGFVSSYLNYSLFWILLFPVYFYHMRSWSKQNWGSLITGILLSIWLCYAIRFAINGEDAADTYILSYTKIIDNLMPDRINYTFCEWGFLSFIALLLIIYSISGFAINVAKTLKAHASIIMLSTLSLIITILAIIDLSHLPNYLGILSIFLSLQLSIHQSCLINIKNEWWTIIILLLFEVLSIIPLFWKPF